MHHQRRLLPYHARAAFAGEPFEEQTAGVLACLVHVDVRIRLEPHDDIGILYDLLRDVGMQVERNGNRRIRRGGAHALEQIALAVVAVFRDHRPMQVEQDRIDAARRSHNPVAQGVVGARRHRTARVGGSADGGHHLRPGGLGEIDERGHRRTHALVVAIGRFVIRGS